MTADGATYNFNLAYVAATGLLDTLEYPLSTAGYRLKLGYEYASGLLKRVKDANGPTVFWEAVSTDAWGHVQDEAFGNGVATFSDFDQASGLLQSREGGVGGGTGLIHAQVDWDLNGNLTERQDLKLAPAVTETFHYDALNRFDDSQRNGATNADVTLDAIGNITYKLGVGNYAYHATKKRAVISAGSNTYGYDANGNMTSRNGSSISYTSYNLPSVINAPGGASSALSYGAFRNRYKQVAVSGGVTETTIYVAGLLEQVTRAGVTEYRHTIHGGAGPAALHTRVSGGAASTYYVHADHLGSPELITDNAGAALVRPSFAAYGERRDGSDWSGAPSAGDLTTLGNLTRRGFTGHEHLDAVGLIHMNGRVYEPVAGRFLSRDPFIDGVASSQGPNGYAYVHNNPLTFTDPSGFGGYCANPDLLCPQIDGDSKESGGFGRGRNDHPIAFGPRERRGGANLPGNRTPTHPEWDINVAALFDSQLATSRAMRGAEGSDSTSSWMRSDDAITTDVTDELLARLDGHIRVSAVPHHGILITITGRLTFDHTVNQEEALEYLNAIHAAWNTREKYIGVRYAVITSLELDGRVGLFNSPGTFHLTDCGSLCGPSEAYGRSIPLRGVLMRSDI